MESAPGEITRLLAEVRGGNRSVESQLAELLYPELHKVAERYMRRERGNHTLQPTVLVNEAYMQLAHRRNDWKSRAHFIALAAQVMRQILVDYARQNHAVKRGGEFLRVEFNPLTLGSTASIEKFIALDEALSRLAEWDPRQARIVELRFFGGLTEEELAEVTGTSVRTVRRDWSMAKDWLHSQIGR